MEQRNTEHRRNKEDPGTVEEQLNITGDTSGTPRNNGKRRRIVVFLRENLKLKVYTSNSRLKIFIADINYSFISLFLSLVLLREKLY